MNIKWGLFFALLLFLIIAVFALAGVRFDLFGNSIINDVVAPAGGRAVSDSSDNRINASSGQCSAGISTDASGASLYHGVHAPSHFTTEVKDWKMINQ